MEFGQALAAAGSTTAGALAWNAFDVPAGAPPKLVKGDFRADQPYDPDSPDAASQFVRRYGISLDGTGATVNGSKGSIDGGERRFDLAILVQFIHERYGQVTSVDKTSLYDAFYVLTPGGQTVYAAEIFPWLLAKGHPAPVQPGEAASTVSVEPGVLMPDTLGPRLDALAAKVDQLQNSIDTLLARTHPKAGH